RSRASRHFVDPIPMARVVWEHADVTGRRGLHPKLQILPLHHPSFRNRFTKSPITLPAARFRKLALRRFPLLSGERCLPFCLGFRTNQRDFAESLKLLSIA